MEVRTVLAVFFRLKRCRYHYRHHDPGTDRDHSPDLDPGRVHDHDRL